MAASKDGTPMIPSVRVAVTIIGCTFLLPVRGGAQDGVWTSETFFSPGLRGELNVVRGATGWHATIQSAESRFRASGDSVRFAFPADQGQFRGKLTDKGRSIAGFWIQPTRILGQPFASPLTLRPVGAAAWRANVVSLEEPYSLYILFTRNPAGVDVATFRNPEFNERNEVSSFAVTRRPDSVIFTARPDSALPEIRMAAAYDTVRKQLTLFWPPRNRLIVLSPTTGEQALNLTPRVPQRLPYQYRIPAATGDGWETSSARAVGFEPSRLAAMIQSVSDTSPALPRFPAIHSILIARKGKLVLEEYFAGYDRDRPHDTRSAGKTFSSVMLGAVMLRGTQIGPDSRISTFVAGPYANPDPRKGRITLANLMTHSSGLDCDDNGNTTGSEDKMQSQRVQPDYWKYMLDLPMANDPGRYYWYCSGGMNLMGAALTAATRTWLPDLFDRTIARPLQFGRYYYNLAPNLEGYLGGGVFMRPRDLLKVGQLYLNGGVWNDRRIVSQSWVATSTAKQFESDGYAWHLGEIKSGKRVYREYEANGNGGQLLMMVPELDLAVVFTAGNYGQYGIWGRYRDDLLANAIIPAIAPGK
jgi:CubicO group peptidase (beta-lactamase class C family)